jgi:hypothetical protein
LPVPQQGEVDYLAFHSEEFRRVAINRLFCAM